MIEETVKVPYSVVEVPYPVEVPYLCVEDPKMFRKEVLLTDT